MNKHTPTPWVINPKAKAVVMTADGHTICNCGCSSQYQDEWEKNAAFIVKACNAHDDLVALIKRSKEFLTLAIENAKEKGDDAFLGYALTLDRVNLELFKLEGK